MIRVFGLVLCLMLLPVFAAEVNEDPLERQMLDIAKELRCTVCQNQPIAESDADLARDMRQIIREQITAGKSRQEIINYFVDRYGDYVLMQPPARGPGLLVWVGPLLVLVMLGASALVYLRHRQRTPLAPSPKLSEEDAARVRAARQDEP